MCIFTGFAQEAEGAREVGRCMKSDPDATEMAVEQHHRQHTLVKNQVTVFTSRHQFYTDGLGDFMVYQL